MPSSLELSISLPSSALKKSFHSPQRESTCLTLHVSGISYLWWALPAWGRKSHWRTNSVGNVSWPCWFGSAVPSWVQQFDVRHSILSLSIPLFQSHHQVASVALVADSQNWRGCGKQLDVTWEIAVRTWQKLQIVLWGLAGFHRWSGELCERKLYRELKRSTGDKWGVVPCKANCINSMECQDYIDVFGIRNANFGCSKTVTNEKKIIRGGC